MEKKHKMDKAAPASYHKHICVWFCQKKVNAHMFQHPNCTLITEKNTIFSDICLVFLFLFVFLQLLCELMTYTSVGLFCFEVYIYIKHY